MVSTTFHRSFFLILKLRNNYSIIDTHVIHQLSEVKIHSEFEMLS